MSLIQWSVHNIVSLNMNAKPNLRLCDENDAMQVEPSLEHVLTQIDSLKTEFADIEANLYEQLAIDGQR